MENDNCLERQTDSSIIHAGNKRSKERIQVNGLDMLLKWLQKEMKYMYILVGIAIISVNARQHTNRLSFIAYAFQWIQCVVQFNGILLP